MFKKKGNLIWITGLSGSGKTTIAKGLQEKLGNLPIHLDGDNLREILGETTTYDIEGRKRTARIYSKLCNYLVSQGFDVIMSTISLIHEIHEYNRRSNPNYYEVFLEVNPDILTKRDKKQLYTIKNEQVMGLTQEPEYPKNPNLILPNNYKEQIEENVQKIMEILKKG